MSDDKFMIGLAVRSQKPV